MMHDYPRLGESAADIREVELRADEATGAELVVDDDADQREDARLALEEFRRNGIEEGAHGNA